MMRADPEAQKVKWKIENRGSLSQKQRDYLVGLSMYYSRNKGFAKDSPKASSSTWKGAAARSDNNFSLKVLRFPNEGYRFVSFSMQVTHCRYQKDGPNKEIQAEMFPLA